LLTCCKSTAASAERVFEFLDEEEEVPDPVNAVKTHGSERECTSRMSIFGYNPDRVIIHNFSADIKPGQKVALVGPTGAGKNHNG